MINCVVPFIEPDPEDMFLSGGGDTMACLRKWTHCHQEEKRQLHEEQECLMGDVLNLQVKIGRGWKDEGFEDKFGTICEGIHMENHIIRQGSTLMLQANDGIDKVKAIDLNKTEVIKAEIQTTIELVNNMYQGQRRPIEYLNNEVGIMIRGMINAPSLKQWSEDMDSKINPVLHLLDECKNTWVSMHEQGE